MFFSLDFVSIKPPVISDFFNNGILSGIGDFFDFIFIFFGNVFSAINNFYSTLVEINEYVVELGNSASSGSINGLPILETVGAYRYIVTDPVFYFTYVLVLSACLFTIFKLIVLLIKLFGQMKESLRGNGKTSKGLMYYVTKIFK